MSKQALTEEELRLVRRLRREAMSEGPVFSESLHRRIVASIEQSDLNRPAFFDSYTRGNRRGIFAGVLAAACLLCFVVLGFQFIERGSPNGVVDSSAVAKSDGVVEPSLPSGAPEGALSTPPLLEEWTDATILGLQEMADMQTSSPQAAYLDHDARLATETLLRRLPIDLDVLLAGN